jgi:hypothetical protein
MKEQKMTSRPRFVVIKRLNNGDEIAIGIYRSFKVADRDAREQAKAYVLELRNVDRVADDD